MAVYRGKNKKLYHCPNTLALSVYTVFWIIHWHLIFTTILMLPVIRGGDNKKKGHRSLWSSSWKYAGKLKPYSSIWVWNLTKRKKQKTLFFKKKTGRKCVLPPGVCYSATQQPGRSDKPQREILQNWIGCHGSLFQHFCQKMMLEIWLFIFYHEKVK